MRILFFSFFLVLFLLLISLVAIFVLSFESYGSGDLDSDAVFDFSDSSVLNSDVNFKSQKNTLVQIDELSLSQVTYSECYLFSNPYLD
jgi:hypothetical protein